MNVLILGAGALGSLFGARLSNADVNLSLLSTNSEHVQAVARSGLIVEELGGKEKTYNLEIYDDVKAIKSMPELVLVMVKAYDTETAVKSIIGVCSETTLFLTLQNGVGNYERIKNIVGDKVVAGTTTQGASFIGPGRIRHGGNGATCVGSSNEHLASSVKDIVALFNNAGLSAEICQDVEKLIWEKLIINAGINPVTAIAGVKNGAIWDNHMLADVCRAIVEECKLVAEANGIEIHEDMVSRVLGVAKATHANRSSMGQDIDRKRPTEIDAINGAIVTLGQKVRVKTPVNLVLTQLVKAMEKDYSLRINTQI